MGEVQQQVDRLYKKQYGKMIAMLLDCFHDMDIATAEGVVQDVFSTAVTSWNDDDIPANAEGWLFEVCRNKAINKLKESKRKLPDEIKSPGVHETVFSEPLIKDRQLKLLFACAHPDLSPKAQVVITLK